MAVQAQYPANIFRVTMNSNVLDQQHDFYQFRQNNNLITTPGNVFGNTYTSFGKQQSNLINRGITAGAVLSGDHLAAESELTSGTDPWRSNGDPVPVENSPTSRRFLGYNEKLRSVIEETQKRQCRSLVSAVEEQVLKRIAEKETELQNTGRKNAELEEKLKQLNAENQIWFNVAKNNEAIVSSLKSTLQEILLQNNNTKSSVVEAGGELLSTPNTTNNNHDIKEGFGDSDGLVIEGLDDDTQSCCYGGRDNHNQEEKKRRLIDAVVLSKEDDNGTNSTIKKSCKICEKNEVSVLVLPCRHLCLCKECENDL